MDLLDILIAKNQSFTGETAKLTKQAQAAMAKANEVAAKIDEASEALAAAQEAQTAAETANTRAQEIAAELEDMKEEVTSAASEVVDEKLETAVTELQTSIDEAVTEVTVEDDNTSTYKGKKAKVRKKGILNAFNIFKNYVSTGSNEDGSMTQKAITNALNALNTRIDNIPTNPGSNSESGNISGNITGEDSGSIVIVDENGNIAASSITEEDMILTQIAAGTYSNNNILGLEIDYENRAFRRLQGATQLSAGADFDNFSIFGGRKRCIVNNHGEITRFVTNEDTLETLNQKRIMVYQPAVYYLRIPTSVTSTDRGIKINKEQIYVSDTKYAGFKLHPLFLDDLGNPLSHVLLPAFESGTLRGTGTWELNDAQDIDFNNDKLVSIVNNKPISGTSQQLTYANAKKMAQNNGSGWKLTDLRFESLQQMLMIIEFGSLNIQNAFNAGVTNASSIVNTGTTISLLNASGQAANTIAGNGAISYRGVENPYGNTWRFVGDLQINNYQPSFNNQTIAFKIPAANNWINAFGYDASNDWIFLPIEVSNTASNNLPVGDFLYVSNSNNTICAIIGGTYNSQENSGPFYYGLDREKDIYYNKVNSARIMYIPVANSSVETGNYNLWLQG